jgi:hypothetical protein
MSTWFLVVADYTRGETTVSAFAAPDDAMTAYAAAELENRGERGGAEVVLIASDDEASLRLSYPHLFASRHASKRAAIRMLKHPAYV